MPARFTTAEAMASEIAKSCNAWGAKAEEVVALIERLCALVHLKKENYSVLVTMALLHRCIHKQYPSVNRCELKESLFEKVTAHALEVIAKADVEL